MCLCSQVCHRVLVDVLEHFDTALYVAQIQGVLEHAGHIASVLCNLGHAVQFVVVAGSEVQERQLVEVAQFLVAHLHDLVVSVRQCLGTETLPKLGSVELFGHLYGNIEVATLNRKLKSSLRVLHKLESNLGVALLLEVRDDALTDQAGSLDNVEHLIVMALDQRELETVLCRVDCEDLGLRSPVEAVDTLALHTNQVDGVLKSANNTVVAVHEGVLDVIEGRVKEDAGVIPACALDPDSLVQSANLLEGLCDDRNVVFAEKSSVEAIGRPDDILDARNSKLSELLLLLDVVQVDVCRCDEEQTSGSAKHHVESAMRRLDSLGGRVGKILDVDLLVCLGEDGETVARDEHSGCARTTHAVCWLNGTRCLSRQVDQLVGTTVRWRCYKNGSLGRVV